MRTFKGGIAVALALVAATSFAHEIGTTRVHAAFRRDHTYRIEITTAPRVLARMRGFADACEVRFGDVRVVPRVDVLPRAIDSPSVTIRLSGEIPPSAKPFTWRYRMTYAAYALTIENEGHGATAEQWLDADSASAPFVLSREVLPPTRIDVVRQYLALGFTHIVPFGLDHILFVLGIFLLSTRLRPVLMQVTAFTVAHSITLGLTIYGLLSVSPRVVEPLIALSIVYVAVENLMTTELKPWRVAIVFAFGLLHGMGFAGVLKELGLPRSEFVTALVTFNVGVELGQLSVIASAFVLIAAWHRAKPWYRPRFVVPASMAIAATGVFWTIQRLL